MGGVGRTLDGVAVHVAEAPDLEVAQSDARKVARLDPIASVEQVVQQPHAVPAVKFNAVQCSAERTDSHVKYTLLDPVVSVGLTAGSSVAQYRLRTRRRKECTASAILAVRIDSIRILLLLLLLLPTSPLTVEELAPPLLSVSERLRAFAPRDIACAPLRSERLCQQQQKQKRSERTLLE